MIYKEILDKINSYLEPLELECYPFLVKWYNSRVDEKFKLNYADNTLACLVINRPKMFEKLFLEYIFEKFKKNPDSLESHNDLIDECFSHTFSQIKHVLEKWFSMEIDVVKDYEMVPGTRRPKIVMQTCAHVSGAAYFYDPKSFDHNLIHDCEKSHKKNLMGVCLHPRYGGWFAMRGVFFFKDIVLEKDEISLKQVGDPLNGDMTKILDVLKKFNFNWKDSQYRDVIPVEQSYSHLQRQYFDLEPRCRKNLIKKWLTFANANKLIEFYQNDYKEKSQKEYLSKNFFII